MELEQQILESLNKELRKKGKRESTIKTYQREIQRFLNWLIENGGDAQRLTRFEVQSYIRQLESNRQSAVTIHKIFACITAFAKFMNKPDTLVDISLPKVHAQGNIAPRSLDRLEQNKLLREIERSENKRNIAITYLLLMTGIRVSELVALNREDVTYKERSGVLTIRGGKGNTQREIPLAKEARHYLKRYLDERNDQEQALFLSNFRQRMSIRSVQHMLKRYEVHPHQLRHTFCRQMVAAGIDIATVADLAGHLDLNVTQRYTKPSKKELEESIERVFID